MRYIVRNAIFCVTTKPCNSSQAREKQTSVRRYYPDSRSSGFLSALLRAITHQHKAPVSIDDCTALCRRQTSKREKNTANVVNFGKTDNKCQRITRQMFPKSAKPTTNARELHGKCFIKWLMRALCCAKAGRRAHKNVRKQRTNVTYARKDKAKTPKLT